MIADMLYIGGLIGSLIVIGFAVYPIAIVIEAVSRQRKKLRQVREHQDEAKEYKYSGKIIHQYDTPERGNLSSAGEE